MAKILAMISGYVISSLIFRLLSSIGFGLASQAFVHTLVQDYLQKSINEMNTVLGSDIAAYLNLLRADECISIIIGSISFVATYKSLKLIFVRQAT